MYSEWKKKFSHLAAELGIDVPADLPERQRSSPTPFVDAEWDVGFSVRNKEIATRLLAGCSYINLPGNIVPGTDITFCAYDGTTSYELVITSVPEFYATSFSMQVYSYVLPDVFNVRIYDGQVIVQTQRTDLTHITCRFQLT